MAFQFVPDADGGFTEGDKQTNSETGQEYIFSDGAWRALGTEVGGDLDSLDERYVKKDGDTMTSSLKFNRGKQASNQFSITPNSGSPNVNIYTLLNGQMRFRTTHTDHESDNVGSHIILDPNGGVPLTKIYNVVDPTNGSMCANKQYVDDSASGKKIPPGLRYKFNNQTSVFSGQLAYFEDAGGLRLRISNTTKDVVWNTSGPTADISYNEGHMFTIYYLSNNGNWNIIRQGTINRIDWHATDILCYVSSHQTNGSFETDTDYYVTIAGIC